MNLMKLGVVSVALGFACEALAGEWIQNVKVQKISGYQHGEKHFVWFSEQSPECDKSSVTFLDSSLGGRSMLSLLLSAQMSQVNVDVQVEGCELLEVYIKAPGSS